MLLLQCGLQVRKRRHAALRVFVDPPVVDQPNGHRVQEVQLLPARPARDDEACVFEDAQVLHHAEARHLQLGLELGERAAVTRKEQVEEEAARPVGDRLEHAVVIGHGGRICDRTVTCQDLPGAPHDWRTTSSPCSRMSRVGRSVRTMRSSIAATAAAPISAVGCRNVVNGTGSRLA
jgi:hypothetical protein